MSAAALGFGVGVRSLLGTAALGLRARRFLTLGCAVLIVISVAAAIVGPMYQAAAASSYLVSKLRSEPLPEIGVQLHYTPLRSQRYPAALERAAPLSAAAVGATFGAPTLALWTRRLPTIHGGIGTLLARAGACAHLTVVGRCPRRPGETMILRADSQLAGLSLGQRLDVAGVSKPLTIVGIYTARPFDARFWFDPSDLVSVPPSPPGSGPVPPYQPAPFIVTPATFDDVAPGSWFVRGTRRLVVTAHTDGADLTAALRGVAAVEAAARARGVGPPTPGEVTLEPGNELAAIARELRQREATARSTVAPAVVSVIFVALVLLLRLLAAVMDLRRPELALASLRGLSRRQMWLLGLVEPVLIVVVATPVGIGAGILGARALGAVWLVPGLPVPVAQASLLAAVAVVLAALVVSAFVVREAFGEPLASQIAAVRRPGRPSRWTLVLQLVLGASAVAVLAATLSHQQKASPDATDLALPILLAAATGLAVTWAARTASRGWAAATSRRRGVSGYLASRAISRRREGTLVVLPLATALGIAVFAAGIFTAAADWRASDAATLVGASRSYATKLTVNQAVALTHELDPRGRSLMAVGAAYTPPGERLVMDTPRLPRVGVWPTSWTPGLTAAQVAHDLAPRRPPVLLTGSRLSVTLDDRVAGDFATLTVSFIVLGADGENHDVLVGPFAHGVSTASARLPACASGCMVKQVAFGGPAGLPEAMSGTARLTDLRVDGAPIPNALSLRWRKARQVLGTPQAVAAVPRAPGSIEVRFSSTSPESFAAITPDDVPRVRPILVGRTAQLNVQRRLPGGVLRLATDQSISLDVHPVVTSESMPILGPSGILIDYTMLTRDAPLADSVTQVFILARSDLPAAVARGLSDHGITSFQTLAAQRSLLDQDAFALALRLYLVVTVIVIALALAGLAANLAVQMPSRRRDAASLRVVGVRRRSILSAVVAEFAVVVGAAAAAGIGAGSLAQYVVVRTVTLGYADSRHTPRLLAGLNVSDVATLAVGVAAGLLVAAVGLAGLTVRGARTASLREEAV